MLPVLIHRGNTYKNAGNRREIVRTVTGKMKNLKVGKKSKKHRCHECNQLLLSIAAMRPAKFRRQKLSDKRVSRPYGGSLCGGCVAKKVTTAFLTEESLAISRKNQ